MRSGAICERDTIENPEEAGCENSLLLSRSAEPTREKSDSDGVMSLLGGRSKSIGSSSPGDMTRMSDLLSMGVPTKQQRVMTSSRTASVRTSCGTRVDRVAAGMFAAALREVGGGR